MELTDEDIKEIEAILRKRCKKYSEKAIAGIVKTINQLRNGTIQLTDYLVPDICTYEDFILDSELGKFLKTDST